MAQLTRVGAYGFAEETITRSRRSTIPIPD
jgi:hypothetical protein